MRTPEDVAHQHGWPRKLDGIHQKNIINPMKDYADEFALAYTLWIREQVQQIKLKLDKSDRQLLEQFKQTIK